MAKGIFWTVAHPALDPNPSPTSLPRCMAIVQTIRRPGGRGTPGWMWRNHLPPLHTSTLVRTCPKISFIRGCHIWASGAVLGTPLATTHLPVCWVWCTTLPDPNLCPPTAGSAAAEGASRCAPLNLPMKPDTAKITMSSQKDWMEPFHFVEYKTLLFTNPVKSLQAESFLAPPERYHEVDNSGCMRNSLASQNQSEFVKNATEWYWQKICWILYYKQCRSGCSWCCCSWSCPWRTWVRGQACELSIIQGIIQGIIQVLWASGHRGMCEFRFRLANRKSKLAELNSCQVSGGTVAGLKGTQVPCLIDWMCAWMIGHKGSNRLPLAKSAPTSSARLSRRKSSIGLSRWAPVICAEIFCIEDTCVAATCRTTKFTLNQACFPGNTAGLLLEMAESGFNHFAGTSLRELPFLLNSCEDTGSMVALPRRGANDWKLFSSPWRLTSLIYLFCRHSCSRGLVPSCSCWISPWYLGWWKRRKNWKRNKAISGLQSASI